MDPHPSTADLEHHIGRHGGPALAVLCMVWQFAHAPVTFAHETPGMSRIKTRISPAVAKIANAF